MGQNNVSYNKGQISRKSFIGTFPVGRKKLQNRKHEIKVMKWKIRVEVPFPLR